MGYELSHDSLAKQIYNKVSSKAQTRRKVEKFANEKYAAYKERNATLTQDDLDYILPHLKVINISPEVTDFLRKGKERVIRSRYSRVATLIGLVTFFALTLLLIYGYITSERLKEAAQNQKNAAFAQKGMLLAKTNFDKDITKAVNQGRFFYSEKSANTKLEKGDNEEAYKHILNYFYHLPPIRPFYKEMDISGKGNICAVNPENRDLLTLKSGKNNQGDALMITKPGKGGRIFTLLTEDIHVYRAIFYPNEKAVLIAGQQKKGLKKINYLYRWEYQKSVPKLEVITQLSGELKNVFFSEDGQYLITFYQNKTTSLFRLEGSRYKPLFTNRYLIGAPTKLRTRNKYYLPKGYYFKHRNAKSPNITELNPLKNISSASNGQFLLGHYWGGEVIIWDQLGKMILDLSDKEENVKMAEFLPNKDIFLTWGENNEVKAWNLNKEVVAIFAAEELLSGFFIGQNGERLFTAYRNGKLKKWDLTAINHNPLAQIFHFEEALNSIQFSPNGDTILIASTGGKVGLQSLKGNKAITYFDFKHRAAVNTAYYSEDGKKVVTASDDTYSAILDVATRKLILDHPIKHNNSVSKAVFMPDGKTIFSLSFTQGQVWNLAGISLGMDNYYGVKENAQYYYNIADASFSPTGDTLLVVSPWADGSRLWNFKNFDFKSPLNIRPLAINQENKGVGLYSRDGKKIILSKGNLLEVFNNAGEKQFSYIYNEAILKVALSNDASLILVAYADNTVKLLNVFGNELMHFVPHQQVIKGLAFSPDNKYFATISADSTLKVWPLKEQLLFKKLPKNPKLKAFTNKEKIANFYYGADKFKEENNTDELLEIARLFLFFDQSEEAVKIFTRLENLSPNSVFVKPEEKVNYLNYRVRDFLQTDDTTIIMDAARYYDRINDKKCARKLFSIIKKGSTKFIALLSPSEEIEYLNKEKEDFLNAKDSLTALKYVTFFKSDEKFKSDSLFIRALFKQVSELCKVNNWEKIAIKDRETYLGYGPAEFLDNNNREDLINIYKYFITNHQRAYSKTDTINICKLYEKALDLKVPPNYISDADKSYYEANCQSIPIVLKKATSSKKTVLVHNN